MVKLHYFFHCGTIIIVNHKNLYNSHSPGGRELERGEIHPHLDPLPSRERKCIGNCVEDYKQTFKSVQGGW